MPIHFGRGQQHENQELWTVMNTNVSSTNTTYLKIIVILTILYLTNHELYSTYIALKSGMSMGLNKFITKMLIIWPISIFSIVIIAFHQNKYVRIIGAVLLGSSTLISYCFYSFYHYTINIYDFKYLLSIYDNILLPGVAVYLLEICSNQIMVAIAFSIAIALRPKKTIFKSNLWLIPTILPVLVLSSLIEYNITAGDALPSQFWVPTIALASSQIEDSYPQDIAPNIAPEPNNNITHVVFIMDESIRGDFVNSAAIAPFLSRVATKYNYGWTTAANNTSMGSNLVVRYGLNKQDINRLNFSTKPSIWSYAKEAGYSTTYIDCQNNASLQNHMNIYELSHIDNFLQLNSTDIANKDMEAIPIIKKILASKTKQFIYINKSGAHIPYRNKYPINSNIFQTTKKNNSLRAITYNYYANAVHWATDVFFKRLLPTLNLKNTAIIYTSDHGQNIMDDGTTATHTRREHANWQEALVPLFVFTTNTKLTKQLTYGIKHNLNNVSSLNIFPTLLYLLGYKLDDIHQKYGNTIFEKILAKNNFFPGSIMQFYRKTRAWQQTPWPAEAPITTFKVIHNEVIPA
jgi:glucan phosphoethanolaminetransferase (alkaline phosphatase superfamily)